MNALRALNPEECRQLISEGGVAREATLEAGRWLEPRARHPGSSAPLTGGRAIPVGDWRLAAPSAVSAVAANARATEAEGACP